MSDLNDFRSAEQQLQQAALLFLASFSFDLIHEASQSHIYAIEDLLFNMVNAYPLSPLHRILCFVFLGHFCFPQLVPIR